MSSDNLDINNIVLKTQKKFLSSFSKRHFISAVLDEDGKKLLNSAYILLKGYYKKEAKKLISRWIKILIKITLLIRNNMLNGAQLNEFHDVQLQFQNLVKIISSFWMIEYSYDVEIIQDKLNLIESKLLIVTTGHMQDKNRRKLQELFIAMKSKEFLNSIFNYDQTSHLYKLMDNFVKNLESIPMTLNA